MHVGLKNNIRYFCHSEHIHNPRRIHSINPVIKGAELGSDRRARTNRGHERRSEVQRTNGLS